MKNLWKKIKSWFTTEWLLTIYFPGLVTGQRIKKEFRLKRVTKLTNTHARGITIEGREWEIKNSESFDYRLEKIR